MKICLWRTLDQSGREAALQRPQLLPDEAIRQQTRAIIEAVREGGDEALRRFSQRFDGVAAHNVSLSRRIVAAAQTRLEPRLKEAMQQAIDRLRRFHQDTGCADIRVETAPGVLCESLRRPIDCVGLYVPGGQAPLVSTLLMLGVPARIAACRRIVVCTPPDSRGAVADSMVFAASLLGIERIHPVGGAQAIAAMAYGTQSIPRCDKIFGPGNRWVTAAKQHVSRHVAIDMPAGPSELMVIADQSATAEFVAADLLSQAEHGADSQVLLVATQLPFAETVVTRVRQQLENLPRAEIARQSLEHARFLIVENLDEAIAIANRYAPEHLIIQTESPRQLLPRLKAAGSIFLGPWSPEAIGDYCSGTNHVLPTAGFARALGGIRVASFTHRISVQELSPEGLAAIGPCAEILASAEGLEAHRRAIALRRNAVNASRMLQ